MEGLYEQEGRAPLQHLQSALTDERNKAEAHASGDSLAGVVWTPSMRRMYTLLDRYARAHLHFLWTLCCMSLLHISGLQDLAFAVGMQHVQGPFLYDLILFCQLPSLVCPLSAVCNKRYCLKSVRNH